MQFALLVTFNLQRHQLYQCYDIKVLVINMLKGIYLADIKKEANASFMINYEYESPIT